MSFVMIFAVLAGVFFALIATPFFEKQGWPAYLRLNAEVCGAILRFAGQAVTVVGQAITSPRGSLRIEPGCDAIHPSALFVAAVLASPVSVRSKLPGVFVGALLLALANLIRIISLFYIQIHFPRAFEIMHVEVWQALFIFLAVLLWVVWIRRAMPGRPVHAHVTS